jgi:CrcB protein
MTAGRDLLWIALAGALGALSRYGLSTFIHRRFGDGMAWGTLTVNVLGSLALGLIVQIGLSSDALPKGARLALTVGFLGAFTTFSTFSYETFRYLDNGSWGTALVNVLANLIPGLLAVWAGMALGRLLVAG